VRKEQAADFLLASGLRAGKAPEPDAWPSFQQLIERIHWHGISGLLAWQQNWPEPVGAAIRSEAVARAMWELRHRQLLVRLLAKLADQGIRALLLKGSAFAYDLYEEPAERIRGDTDLWIAAEDRHRVRAIFRTEGFHVTGEAAQAPALALQEAWVHAAADGSVHALDLHWSAINSLYLHRLFDFERCWESRRPLPRLGAGAFGLDHEEALLHAAVHRAMHTSAPYKVANVSYRGGDRLLWAKDVAHLACALGNHGLVAAVAKARARGVSAPLSSALRAAREWLGAAVPEAVSKELDGAPSSPAARYLAAGRLRRVWLDLGQVRGPHARLGAVAAKLFPAAVSVGEQPGSPRISFHMRRWADLLMPSRGRR
jgi:hypothetical protein